MIRSQLKFGSSSVWAMCDCCDVYNVLTLLSWRLWMNFFGHPPAPLHPPPGVISFLFNNLTLLSLSLDLGERMCGGSVRFVYGHCQTEMHGVGRQFGRAACREFYFGAGLD